MQGPGGQRGDLLEQIMSRLKAAGVLKEDERDHPHHYNRAWELVLEALELQGITGEPAPVEGSGTAVASLGLPLPWHMAGQTGRTSSDKPNEAGKPKQQVPESLLNLAKLQGRSFVPNGWPRLRVGEFCMVTTGKGVKYAMQVWRVKGKQVTFLSQGEVQVKE